MVRLVRAPIDLAALQATLPQDGALCVFVGVVRNENGGRLVTHLEYEAYEDMAVPLMEQIEAETRARWPVTEVRLVHRLGRLEIGEASVAVAVSSPHRAEAFAACRHAIDTLKARVPIWKKEFYADGSEWLGGSEGAMPQAAPGPPVEEPPDEEPPVKEPPLDEPARREPPTKEPPVEEPPVQDPPAPEPPPVREPPREPAVKA